MKLVIIAMFFLAASGKWTIVSTTTTESGNQLIDEMYTLPSQSSPCGEVLSTEDSKKLVRYYTAYKGSILPYWYTTQREAEVFIEQKCD